MADFKTAFDKTMGHEGGYANNPKDTGGETYKGIARKYNAKWKGWPIIDAIKAKGNTTASAINKVAASDALLQEYVRALYKARYWDVNKLSDIADQQLANNVFDMGVNSGTDTAAKMLQKAANAVTACDIVTDGVIGAKTIATVNSLNPKLVYDAFNNLRKQKYDSIIAANPSQAVFRASWYSRIKPYAS